MTPQNEENSLRYNQGKIDWTLVDFRALEPLVRVLEYGSTKYERNNWKKKTDKQVILQSLFRHTIDLLEGKEYDDESRELTIGHILANALFYSYHLKKEQEQLKEILKQQQRSEQQPT